MSDYVIMSCHASRAQVVCANYAGDRPARLDPPSRRHPRLRLFRLLRVPHPPSPTTRRLRKDEKRNCQRIHGACDGEKHRNIVLFRIYVSWSFPFGSNSNLV